jgi:hypothetical protein
MRQHAASPGVTKGEWPTSVANGKSELIKDHGDRSLGTTQSGERAQPPRSRVSSAGRNRLSSSPSAARPRRFIMSGRRQGFAFRFGANFAENAFEHFYAGRKRVPVPVDCVGKKPPKRCRFVIG